MEIITSSLLAEAGFSHGFTTREGGICEGPYRSANLAFDVGDDPARVANNLRSLERAVAGGLPLARPRQVHGNEAITADAALLRSWAEAPTIEADALISGERAAVLAVQTADCAAVLLADPRTRTVAAVHAGWRGAAGGVVRNAVRLMSRVGVAPGGLLAAIGPCICEKCYEVGEEVARRLPESADPIRRSPGKYTLDLANAVEVSLVAAGLTMANVERVGGCTACGDLFFSHRATGGPCGRCLGFIRSEPRKTPVQ